MSALAMILTAALAVPGDMPEKMSGQMEQKLDLSGEWEGMWWHAQGFLMPAASTPVTDNSIVGILPGGIICIPLTSITDEGKGKFRIAWDRDISFGIYKQHGDLVVLCFRPPRKGYPKWFWGGKGQHLLILYRPKPSDWPTAILAFLCQLGDF